MLIGLALVGFLGAVYWYAWRPLPKTSGRISAPVSAPASITRDELGVPHIRAASIEDAIFLQGYATAQDRLWQLDAIRRFASGELSEVIGPATLDLDRESRRLRLRRLAEQHTATLPAEDRRWVNAYCRGVNHFLETHQNSLPIEFTLLGYQPRPWTPADTIVVGMEMYRDLTTSWKSEIGKAAMLSRGEAALISQLYPERGGGDVQPGSNAWAISGARTASGKPILANDPHLEWGFPSTWYMVHLEAPGLNVGGASLAGVPGVIIGHNDRIAWGMTNLQYDVQDLYIERFNPQNGQYVVQGKVEQARLERDLIVVKGSRAVESTNWVTRHGPIWSMTGTQSLALRWTAAEFKLFEFPVVQLNQARNWEQFRAALRRFHGPGQNFVYADVDGNIGYQATGALPIRPSHIGDVPVDGASGSNEWDGFVPFDELPSLFNPPSGMIVSSNQNPFPVNFPRKIHGDFDAGYRAQQIRTLLSSRSGWRPQDMMAVQKDVYSPLLHALARVVVETLDKTASNQAQLGAARDLLRDWNGQMEKGTPAPMLIQYFYQAVRRRLSERASPDGPASYISSAAPAAILDILQKKPAGWFTDWNGMIVQCLQRAIDEGSKAQGSNFTKWDYGATLMLELKNTVISQVPYIGKYFNVGPVPMSGASTTIKQTTPRLGPSMRFVADTSNWDQSLNVITLGQSGQVLSSHYKDQWETYWSGGNLPMRWTNVHGSVLSIDPGR